MTEKELQSIKQRYGIVGNSEALNRAIETALKVARVDLSVLIQGENGVGKEIIPRIIHDASPRKNKRYLALNCGAIPEGTIDSELFGHVKGAFTGSVDSREAIFLRLMEEPSSWTRWVNSRFKLKYVFCAYSKQANSSP